ncbi:MAG: glycosyltransferase, partial [Vicinamibacterales bacterium]
QRMNRWLIRRALARWMRTVEFDAPIVWTFLPTPHARGVIVDVDPSLVVYYCIDDFASSSREARRIRHSEEWVFREADLVFVTSEGLRDRASGLNPRVHVFPFGVDFDAFERARLSDHEVPAELAHLPRPIVGYIGGLHQYVDQSLVCAVAEAMPSASIVLVGPEQVDLSALRQHANVHLIGAREHAQLPRYIKAFDVGLVPYRLSDYTAHVYPTKLNEYLAMGIPVVSTDLHEIRQFVRRHGCVVAVADSTDTFVAAVRRACEADDAAAEDRQIAVARENGWTARLEAMSALVEAALEERAARRG